MFYLVCAAVVLADQASKWLVLNRFSNGRSWAICCA
jgi:lipoprotein signal peptidase